MLLLLKQKNSTTPANWLQEFQLLLNKDCDMKKNAYDNTFGIFSSEVFDSEEEVGVTENFAKAAFGLIRQWSSIIHELSGIKIDDKYYFSDNQAILRAILSDDELEFDALAINDTNLHSTVDNVLNLYNLTIKKAADAFASGTVFHNIPDRENRILNLNEIIWALKIKFNARCVIFPDSPARRELVPVDPSTLRLAEIKNNDMECLDNVLLLGVYCCSTLNRDMFEVSDNPLVDIILRVNHNVSEIKTRMLFLEAQSLWRGHKTISCQVELTGRKSGIAIGDIKISDW